MSTLTNQEARILLSTLLLRMSYRAVSDTKLSAYQLDIVFIGDLTIEILGALAPTRAQSNRLKSLYKRYLTELDPNQELVVAVLTKPTPLKKRAKVPKRQVSGISGDVFNKEES